MEAKCHEIYREVQAFFERVPVLAATKYLERNQVGKRSGEGCSTRSIPCDHYAVEHVGSNTFLKGGQVAHLELNF